MNNNIQILTTNCQNVFNQKQYMYAYAIINSKQGITSDQIRMHYYETSHKN